VALYYTRDPQYGSIMQDAEKAMFGFIASNAVDGYYSPTSQSKSAELMLDMSGKLNVESTIESRRPSSWRAAGTAGAAALSAPRAA
jgi:hypothetical protein